MAYILKKRGRFLTGHSYATHGGYSFSWSPNEADARRFADDDPSSDRFEQLTGAKIVHVANTRKELKAFGKRILAAAPTEGKEAKEC